MLIRSFIAAAQLVFAVAAFFAFSTVAQAASITYVASNGNDSRPCTVVTAPCKTLARAVSVTAAHGTVRVLSPVTGGLLIKKSITIAGDGVEIVGQIVIASPSAVVTLQGLALNGIHGLAHGIRIDSAAAVYIANCTIERYTSDGITLLATTATKLFVSNTVARANGADGLHIEDANAQGVIQNSRFEGNANTGVFFKAATASVTGSDASGNAAHGFLLVSPSAMVTETTADNNSGDGFAVRGSVTLNSAAAQGNGAAGLHVETSREAIINGCTFRSSGIPGKYGVNNEGTLLTHENNTILFFHGTSPIPLTLR